MAPKWLDRLTGNKPAPTSTTYPQTTSRPPTPVQETQPRLRVRLVAEVTRRTNLPQLSMGKLATEITAARQAWAATELTGIPMRFKLFDDVSLSMQPEFGYNDRSATATGGVMATVNDRLMALSLTADRVGKVRLGAFARSADWIDWVNLANYDGTVQRMLAEYHGLWGGTNMDAAAGLLLDDAKHRAQQCMNGITRRIQVNLIVTDGDPTGRHPTARLCEHSQYPEVDIFVGIIKNRYHPPTYFGTLRRLDQDQPGSRLWSNVEVIELTAEEFANLTPLQFATLIATAVRHRIDAGIAAGLIRGLTF